MKHNLWEISFKSLLHYKKDALYQFLITLLLAAILAGSLFTGYSVRNSLRNSVTEKLGNTDILISSGLRYFNASLADDMAKATGEKSVAFLETDGYCQNFLTNASALDINIYGIDNNFFSFHNVNDIAVAQGSVIINQRLAQLISISEGDEIVIRFKQTDPLPENAPFAPSEEESTIRKILRVDKIISPRQLGNFYLGISQVEPANIFMNIADISETNGIDNNNIDSYTLVYDSDNKSTFKANRLLLSNTSENEISYFSDLLQQNLKPSDIGLSIRISEKRAEPELISERIFIDNGIVDNIVEAIPTAEPVIAYLINSFSNDGLSSPYSFAAALPYEISKLNLQKEEIAINRWLADDIKASVGDTLELTWFATSSGKQLDETSDKFIVANILEDSNKLLDPTFMPEFPGITASVTCSGWDAGVPILIDKIRDKDELYWNKFKGTPKAFINLDQGRAMWSNNFGNTTAIRFPVDMTPSTIATTLVGAISPDIAGFSTTNVRHTNTEAANSGVDFSSLFLGLSCFIIFSCILLLSMSLTLWFNSKKKGIFTYHALGYNERTIRQLLLQETLIAAAIASVIGSFIGYLVNIFIVDALNSVWIGTVQTDTITPGFSIWPLIIGAISTFCLSAVVIWFKLKKFLFSVQHNDNQPIERVSHRKSLAVFAVVFIVTSLLLLASIYFKNLATILSFISGAFMFATCILAIRQYFIKEKDIRKNYSGLYYSRYPTQIVAPTIFLAAGIFAIAITGANKLKTNDSMLLPSGGTGGYMYWAESAVPVKFDLNSSEGRYEFGFDDEEFNDLTFAQLKRLSGDDASCLNINHVTSPAILGVPVATFIDRGSFSFASVLKGSNVTNPWELLNREVDENTIYGIADQSVLEWSFKMKPGDTLKYVAESGQELNVILCAGLKSSLFQGHLLIGEEHFNKWFPSVSGSSVFLIDGDEEKAENYSEAFINRLAFYGPAIEPSIEKLASFFTVTNTYLNVLMILGVFGMILGTAGLGFILASNFNRRREEFALIYAFGYKSRQIHKLLIKDQIIMLFWGIVTGFLSGITATLPSLRTGNDFSWMLIIVLSVAMFIIGLLTLFLSVRRLTNQRLVDELRLE